MRVDLCLVRWLWLVAGNKYLQNDVVREVGVLDEDGWLNSRVGCKELYKMFLKGVEWKKRWGNKNFKKVACWLKEYIYTIKSGDVVTLQTMDF